MLKGKCIIVGVTGSIASYKTVSLVSMLKKQNADVYVIMTKNATKFITPLTFQVITNNKCLTNMFEDNIEEINHISLAKKADLLIIAPASANTIAKISNGFADDILTTTTLVANCKKLIAPAMNTNMYNNKVTQDNLSKLKNLNFKIIEPSSGLLACKEVGVGKLPEVDIIYSHILKEIIEEKSLKNKNVLISSGATCEYIDSVRYITNPSTGKMGFELAKACILKGAKVTIICGKTSVSPPIFANIINVISAEDMFNSFKKIHKNFDIILKAAAVSDFTPKTFINKKVKKDYASNTIELKRTKDILKYLGENKPENQILCGFSMETENLIENSKLKLKDKNLDLIIANNLKTDGAGFGENTNIVTIIDKYNNIKNIGKMNKFEVSQKIINYITNKFF